MVKRNVGGSGETKLETWISVLLIAGVAVSLTLEAAGLILFYRHNHSAAISHDAGIFIHGRDFFTFLGALVSTRPDLPLPLHLMILGLAVLILTPYIRTAMSVLYFVSVKNVKYVIITLFVLAILTISLTIH